MKKKKKKKMMMMMQQVLPVEHAAGHVRLLVLRVY